MSAWRTTALGKLIEPAGNTAGSETGLPVYSVTKHRGFVPSLEYFNKQVFSRDLSRYTVMQPGEVAYATIHLDEGSIGICPQRCLISPMYTAFRVSATDVYGPYIVRYLKSPRALAEYPRLGKGSVERRKSISLERLGTLQIPLPPLPEQRRIAEILDKADALRAKRRAALAKLDDLTQSIFLKMFGDPVMNQRGWPVCELGELALRITDGEHLNPQFSSSGMPIVMAGDVQDEGVDIEGAQRVENNLGCKFRRKCDPDFGDLLLVSRGATIGRQCVVNIERAFCLMGSVILIKPHRDKLEPRFLNAYLKHPAIRAALYKTSGSSAQQAIYLKDLRRLRCPVPPLPVQSEFARRLASLENTKALGREYLLQLDALFASLQHRAFCEELSD
jgi:type I restriction enzyme, S subunit